MKTTNYSKIADKYEKNSYRITEVSFDQDLNDYLEKTKRDEYHIVDLSCGTGLYLEKQVAYFNSGNIHWYGIDLSDQMLEKAYEKVNNVTFAKADVHQLPYPEETFDYISNNYAFHHYLDKGQALNEIYRVLRSGGMYRLHNIAIQDMPKWWVYHYFPSA